MPGWEDELERWLMPFLDRLGHKTRQRMCPLYVAGLIGPGDRKSVQPMAERCGGSIDKGCLRHENGWIWVGGRQCLATPDDVIAGFISIGLNDCPRPVLTMKSQLDRNHGILDRVAVDRRWGLRRRRTRKHQKRYRKNTTWVVLDQPRSRPGAISRLSLITA